MKLYKKSCVICGSTFITKSNKKKYCCDSCKKCAFEEEPYKDEQLCWLCKKATGQCSWSKDLTPVEGWIAKKTFVKDSSNGGFQSYKIISCPQFTRG